MSSYLNEYIDQFIRFTGFKRKVDSFGLNSAKIKLKSRDIKDKLRELKSLLKLFNDIDGVETPSIFIFDKKSYSFTEVVRLKRGIKREFHLDNPTINVMIKSREFVVDGDQIFIPIYINGSLFCFLHFLSTKLFSKNRISNIRALLNSTFESIFETIWLKHTIGYYSFIDHFYNRVSSYLDNDELQRYLGESLINYFNSERLIISSFDLEKNRVVVEYVKGRSKSIKKGVIQNGFNNMEIVVIDSEESITLENYTTNFIYSNPSFNKDLEGIRSIVVTPLLSERGVIGSIQFHYKEETPFNGDLTPFNQIGKIVGQFIERNRKHRDMEEMATTDYLTNLYIKREFIKLLNSEIEKSKRTNNILSLLMIDVDKFKLINDNYGHLAGDQVLRVIAGIITKSIRKVDIAGRFAGDEFCVVLYNTGLKQAVLTAERIRKNVEAVPVFYNSKRINVTLSIGVSHLKDGDVDYNDLILRADLAMYKGRKGGKRNVVNAPQ
jgi:diguanylate cyclase (GGDEF)-like protein